MLQRLMNQGWNVGLEPTTALGDIPETKGTLVSLWWLVFQFLLSRYSFTRAALIGHCLQGKNKCLIRLSISYKSEPIIYKVA